MVVLSSPSLSILIKFGVRTTILRGQIGSSPFKSGINLSAKGFIWPAIKIKEIFSLQSAMDDRVERLELNAQLAENLISEIYSKLSDIEKSSSKGNVESPELRRLREENESLRLEVAKWKELLIIREIRNGGNPIVRNPAEVGKTANLQRCQSAVATVTSITPKESVDSVPPSAKPSKTNNNNAVGPPADKKAVRFNDETKKGAKGTSSSATLPTVDDVVDASKLDFRIGLITDCQRHPDADSLYVEKIDLGEDKPRTIISGLVKHVPIEKMQNRLVVVLANLKPAKMRGILSEGMVMCASTPDKVEILIPPSSSVAGDVVVVEGFPRNPDPVLNPKKKIFETVQPDLKTNDNREATYKGNLWSVPGKGLILSETLVNSPIK